MKTKLIFFLLLFMSSNYLFAQSKPINIVFDITSKDTVDHRMVLRWVSDIVDVHPEANVEVVFYGKSLDMVVQGKSMATDAVVDLVRKKNVTFNVCSIAMKRNNIETKQLLPGVKVVPDGILEIVSKQNEGWGYIKVSH